jgi:hypothetical protein
VGVRQLFDQNELYDTFHKFMRERDTLITQLKKELTQHKNKDFMLKMTYPQQTTGSPSLTSLNPHIQNEKQSNLNEEENQWSRKQQSA